MALTFDALADWQYVGAAVGAVGTVIGTLYQLHRSREAQREAKAQDYWSIYLAKAIELPALAYPKGHQDIFKYADEKIMIGDTKGMGAAEIDQMHRREFERYEWFVSLLLGTSRLILQQFRNDDYWWTTIQRNIAYHAQYLAYRRSKTKTDEDYIFSYGAEVKDIVKRVIGEKIPASRRLRMWWRERRVRR
jgi:hypothetical protein